MFGSLEDALFTALPYLLPILVIAVSCCDTGGE